MSPRTIAILAAPITLIAVLLIIVLLIVGAPAWLAILLPLAVATIVAIFLHRTAVAQVISMIDAKPITPGSEPRLENMIEELCARAGQSEPEMYVIETASINAAAFASAQSPCLAVTRGLIDKLSVVQLEGIMAREVARLREGRAQEETLVVPFVRRILAPIGGLARAVTGMVIDDDSDAMADIAGMRLTRYPPGLLSAFEAMELSGEPTSVTAGPTAHLWVRSPSGERQWSFSQRMDLLREL